MTIMWTGVLWLYAHSRVGPLARIQNLHPFKSKGPNLQYILYINLQSHKGVFPIRTPWLKASSQPRDSPVGTRYYPLNASIPKRDTWHTFLQEGRHSGSLNHIKTYKYRKDYGYSEQELDIPVWDPRYPRKVNHTVTFKRSPFTSNAGQWCKHECLIPLTFTHREVSVSSLGTLKPVQWASLTEQNTERVSFHRTSYSCMGLLYQPIRGSCKKK